MPSPFFFLPQGKDVGNCLRRFLTGEAEGQLRMVPALAAVRVPRRALSRSFAEMEEASSFMDDGGAKCTRGRKC